MTFCATPTGVALERAIHPVATVPGSVFVYRAHFFWHRVAAPGSLLQLLAREQSQTLHHSPECRLASATTFFNLAQVN
jgi:hypothetical protein